MKNNVTIQEKKWRRRNRPKLNCLIKLGIVIGIIFLVGVILFFSFFEYASWHSVDWHMARVKERVEKNYVTEESGYTSCSVEKLYDQNDEVHYFLVELYPGNDAFLVRVSTRCLTVGPAAGLYQIDSSVHYLKSPETKDYFQKWSRYRDNGEEEYFELDKDGEPIKYSISPYRAAGYENTKKYCLYNHGRTIPAIKNEDGSYLNLISIEKVQFDDKGDLVEQPYWYQGMFADYVYSHLK